MDCPSEEQLIRMALGLGATLASTLEIDPSKRPAPQSNSQDRRLLTQVLIINGAFFVGEFIGGLVAGSMGLIADSLDMLADALVYALALGANTLSLYLLQKSGSQESHMKASMIFTSNDIVINLGVILAGVLVFFTRSPIPDLVVGLIVFTIVLRGVVRILRLR